METNSMLLGQTEVRVSKIGVGVMTWGDAKGLAKLHPSKIAYGGAHGREEETRAFTESLNAGVSLFDTAAMYGGGASEKRLGEIAHNGEAVIATKFPSKLLARAEDMTKDLEASLSRLERTTIDLYQHHFPTKLVPIPLLMDLLADAVEAGKIRAVGVSNYSAGQMRTAHAALEKRGIPLASNQVEYSLLHRQPEINGVLEACRELGATLIAYQPLASGALTGKYAPGTKPKGLRKYVRYFRGNALESVWTIVGLLREIGEKYSKSPSQVALRWLMKDDYVLPIPGAKNAKQAADNAQALSFSLTPEEIEKLSSATLDWRS